jgi:hypothetical protein
MEVRLSTQIMMIAVLFRPLSKFVFAISIRWKVFATSNGFVGSPPIPHETEGAFSFSLIGECYQQSMSSIPVGYFGFSR